MNIFIDIETIPTQRADAVARIAENIKPPATMKKAETIAEWEKNDKQNAINEAVQKTALDGALGQIACIGYAFDNSSVAALSFKNEAEILRLFFDDLEGLKSHSGITFVGHNLTSFDLRFIYHRAVVNGIKPPACFPINPKSWDASIFDTMTYWAGHGNRISLDNLCFALGIDGKSTDYTWENVYPSWQSGDFESIKAYCCKDVEMTRKVYNKLTFNC